MKTLIHEEKYRGESLLKKMSEQSFIICGAGAIGSNLVENMVRQGFKSFTVIDMDRVEDHNRHTQIYDRRDVGQLKVAALKSRIFNLMGITINTVPTKLDAANVEKLLKGNSIIIDGFDNSDSRRLVTDYCLKQKKICLHVGMYQYYAEIVWNQFYRVPNPVKGMDVCEYPLARNTVMMAITIATEAIIRYLDKGIFENYAMTLGDFKIERM